MCGPQRRPRGPGPELRLSKQTAEGRRQWLAGTVPSTYENRKQNGPCVLRAVRTAGRACYRPCVLRAVRTTGRAYCGPCVLQAVRATGRACYRPCVLRAVRTAGRACYRPCVLQAVRVLVRLTTMVLVTSTILSFGTPCYCLLAVCGTVCAQ
jgi:hypothetical protein